MQLDKGSQAVNMKLDCSALGACAVYGMRMIVLTRASQVM